MERLTERDAYWYGEEFWTSAREPDDEEIDSIYMKLKAYEDAEEQGLLLRLPVAIGSDVFFIPSKVNFDLNVLHRHEEFNRAYHQKIVRLHFNENGWYAEGNLYLEQGLVDRLFTDKLYKETWFLTKEEAEAALEKMKGGTE